MAGIRRREVLGGISATALLSGQALAVTRKAAPERPNIVFIMADDLGYADTSATGSRHIRTPAIDSIGAGGVMLRQGYSSTPICSPTRTALLTGCYAQRFAIGVEEPLGPNAPAGIGVPLDRPTIASVMKALGYRTSLVGKWHLGEPPAHGPLKHGYDHFLGIVEGGADYFVHRMVMSGKPAGVGLAEDDAQTDRTGYLTDIFGDEAVRVIEEGGNQPFFLSLHFTAPHWPWEGREDEKLARALPSSFHYEGGNLAKYREMVETMDQNVAKVLAAIDRSGKADNTVVVFTSDNGGERFSDTWPFSGRKTELLEGGLRIPAIVRWPGVTRAGTTSDAQIISMDWLPTFLAAAGSAPDPGHPSDGVDVTPALGGGSLAERALFWRYKNRAQRAVRRGNLKYLRIAENEFLFDVAADPLERANLKDRQPEDFAALKAAWEKWNATMLPLDPQSYTHGFHADELADRFGVQPD